jgi:hypothetical protein
MTTIPEVERLDKIKDWMREIFEAAIESRDAAQRVIDMRRQAEMQITQMQTEIMKRQLAKIEKIPTERKNETK